MSNSEGANEGAYIIQGNAAEPAPTAPPIDAVCAFLVVQDTDGHWIAHFNIDQLGPLSVQRPAHRYDALSAMAVVDADVRAGIYAETALQAQMRAAAQIAQQQEAAKIASGLNLGGGVRPRR